MTIIATSAVSTNNGSSSNPPSSTASTGSTPTPTPSPTDTRSPNRSPPDAQPSGSPRLPNHPNHLIDLLGPVPEDHRARAGWTQYASRVEAYREEWNIEPDQTRDPPRDALQYREWDTAVHTIELINRLDNLRLDRGHERGVDRGLGLEL